MKQEFYVDFNEMVEPDLVLLSKEDVKKNSIGQLITLKEGMPIKIYTDDINDFGEEDRLIANGIVELNTTGVSWTKKAKWCCRIDIKSFKHERQRKQ